MIVLPLGLVLLAIGIRADSRHEDFSLDGMVLGVLLTLAGAALLLGSTQVLAAVQALLTRDLGGGGQTANERGSEPGDEEPGEGPPSGEPHTSLEKPSSLAVSPMAREQVATGRSRGRGHASLDLDVTIAAIEAPATPDDQYEALVSARGACASLDADSRSRLCAAVEKAKTRDGTAEHKAKRQHEIRELVRLLAESPSR